MPGNNSATVITSVSTSVGLLQLKKISCGKPSCTKCPHGPYWYRVYWAGKKVRSEYIGKSLKKDYFKDLLSKIDKDYQYENIYQAIIADTFGQEKKRGRKSG